MKPKRGSPAIRCDGLTKRYGRTVAVDNLSFTVPRGVVYGFLGPNGAGKTTTMRLLTTLTEPTDGNAFVAGTPITEKDSVRRAVGYLPEGSPLHGELTGREQLRYATRLQKVDSGVAEDRIETYSRQLDIADDLDERIETYSTGMSQKLAFIQTILSEPPVLLLDEPTSGLDPQSARAMKDILLELASRGMTVLLSSHILPVVSELADRVGVLTDGSLVAEGTPSSLKSDASDGSDLESVLLSLTTPDSGEVIDDG